ncbi:MAG: hypothetical protein JAY99_12500 [Candidatus Thiodiazotropha lotti]|uniref:RRM domain-containing protein n=1 Tax=Candidatus Thiodiazotropha endoloripes TaxID=1818881 RepID=A0A1E2UPW0_9GAMM|nr:hypothetical protein [Candidatus Thiodiazotropha endoloripes]MCG7898221.1 hypothetical protein [Candidatus Thiodiazotropha weberae]MCG7992343.1 hypothetical protein [Candidatus Thiodiazotropha lotti]MCG7902365.1 hypothetical protein [Candidatus Thiodiazotropha weberae]MCG7912821.1 hypothetical protein [Candidatus Thiodiazotropha weberae]MCG8000339.1 hypothetical protein [Candidatus Thiodiazotropha lotti]
MWIFYKHLPKNVTLKEIQSVTLKGARNNWSPLSIFNKPRIKRTKIIRIRDLQKDSVEYHAIVQVNPTSATETIIENLDGRTVNGLYLRPHRYQRRFANRDRRNMQNEVAQSGERRKSDRRRDNLITRVMAID